jgi:hypothetical protein
MNGRRTGLAWLMVAGLCSAQQVGVSLGPAVFRPSGGLALSNAPTPVNGCAELRFRPAESLIVGFAGGFGADARRYETNSLMTGGRYRTETRISGFPVEVELLASRPLVILSSLRPCVGVGAGYYSYRCTAETRTSAGESEIDADIRGLAQFFIVGCDFRLSRRWIATVRAKKIGFSGLTVKGEDPYEDALGQPATARYENSLAVDPGSGDVSVSVGLLLDLNPGESWSLTGRRD